MNFQSGCFLRINHQNFIRINQNNIHSSFHIQVEDHQNIWCEGTSAKCPFDEEGCKHEKVCSLPFIYGMGNFVLKAFMVLNVRIPFMNREYFEDFPSKLRFHISESSL